MKKWVLVLGLAIMSIWSLRAQEEIEPQGVRGMAIGLHITTGGIGFNINHLRGNDPNKLFLVGLEINSVRDTREVQIESAYGEQGKKYVFGKANHFYVATPSVGIQQNFFPLHANNQLNVRLGIQAGPAIGIVSPYLVEIFESLPGNSFYGRRSIEQFNPEEHAYSDIIGKANFLSEPLETDFKIGLSLKGSAWIDFSRSNHYISAIQLAVNADIFPSEIPIMVVSQNKQVFIAGSLGIVFGNRW